MQQTGCIYPASFSSKFAMEKKKQKEITDKRTFHPSMKGE
jgi:hypothetical protein